MRQRDESIQRAQAEFAAAKTDLKTRQEQLAEKTAFLKARVMSDDECRVLFLKARVMSDDDLKRKSHRRSA